VLTDYEMPGLNGAELRRQLHRIAPAVKICLLTGSGCFTEPAARHEGFHALLNKPVLPADLRTTLTAVFGAKREFPIFMKAGRTA
jgi:CheY-like chemotaxis protein